ncbi:MAG TPA: hypothetical protein VFZ48_01590, partial [Candidatus Saccharimonadales bacterium]
MSGFTDSQRRLLGLYITEGSAEGARRVLDITEAAMTHQMTMLEAKLGARTALGIIKAAYRLGFRAELPPLEQALSAKETRILQAMAIETNNAAIARAVGLTPKTLADNISRLY